MNKKNLSNKFYIESHDIVVLHGKVYEFYKDGTGKLIQSQDIIDVAIKENNVQGKRGKSFASKNFNKIYEINASQTIKNLSVTTVEKIDRDLTELEYLKTRLKILLSELDNKCVILRMKKIEITRTGVDLHDSNNKEKAFSLSDDLSISMPILSPHFQRHNCDTSLEKLNVTSTSNELHNGTECKASYKKLKNIKTLNHSSNTSDMSMPTLSPYYKTSIVNLSNQKLLQRKVDKDYKQLQLMEPKCTSGLPIYLQPVVSIIPLSKSVMANYSVNKLLKTSERKVVKGYPAAKRYKKANSTINSSSEFINSPSKKKIGAGNKPKDKNIKLKISVKNTVLSKNKKSNIKNGKLLNGKPKILSKKSTSSKKSVSSAKTLSAKKKSTFGPKKKLIMSSSLWINRDNDSSSSSPESKKSSLVDSDTSFSGEISKTSMPKQNTSSSIVDKSLSSVEAPNKLLGSNSDLKLLVISDSDEGNNDKIRKSQNNMTPCTLKSTATEFLTPNQSPSDTESNYFTPPKSNIVLGES